MSYPVFNGASVIPLPNLQYADVQFLAHDAVAEAMSPTTGQSYMYQFGAQKWEATITFAAMDRAHVAPWQAFLLQLQGKANVFLLSNPAEANPQGVGFSVVDAQLLNLTPDPGFEDLGSGTWTLPVSTVPYQFTPWTVEPIVDFSPLNQIGISPVTSNNGEVATVSMVGESFNLGAGSFSATIYYVSPPSADVTGATPVVSLIDVATGAVLLSESLVLQASGTPGLPGGNTGYVSGGVTLSVATEVMWQVSTTSALSWTSGSFAVGPILLYPGTVVLGYAGTAMNLTPDPGFQTVTISPDPVAGSFTGPWNLEVNPRYIDGVSVTYPWSVEPIPGYAGMNQLALATPKNTSGTSASAIQSEAFELPAGTYSVTGYYGTPSSGAIDFGNGGTMPTISLVGTSISVSMVAESVGTTGLGGSSAQYITGTFTLAAATTVYWEVSGLTDNPITWTSGQFVVGPLLVYAGSSSLPYSEIFLNFTPDLGFNDLGVGTWKLPVLPDGLQTAPWTAEPIPGFSPLGQMLLEPVFSSDGESAKMVSETFTLTPETYSTSIYFGTPASADISGPMPTISLVNAATKEAIFTVTMPESTSGADGLSGIPVGEVSTTNTIAAQVDVYWEVGVSSQLSWSAGSFTVGPLLLYRSEFGVPFSWIKFVAPSNALTYQSSVDGPPTTTISVAGAPNSTENFLLPGDNIQIGYRLHKVLQPVNTSSTGTANIVIFPYLRDNPAAGTAISITNCAGLFRLKSNQRGWGTSVQNAWGLDPLQLVEAL